VLPMGYFLGIDGGGTRTTAWLADERLRVLARVQTGPSNPVKAGFGAAQRELLKAYRLACRQARIRPRKLHAVCAGLAGCTTPAVYGRMLRWFRKAVPSGAYLLTTDAEVALSAAFGEAPGIVVISGTGSAAYGRDQQGRHLRCGGWGNTFDDGGSGYDLGRKAVRCGLRALDGRGKATSLTRALCRELGLSNLTDAVSLPLAPHDIAALSPVVLREAMKGDAVARGLCKEAADDLAGLALSLIRQFEWNRRAARVICVGGIFHSNSKIRRRFAQQVHNQAPKAKVSLLRREPAEGALILAQQLIR
jgi:N-acetylglucosamine kinase-like BadF-type ATPase